MLSYIFLISSQTSVSKLIDNFIVSAFVTSWTRRCFAHINSLIICFTPAFYYKACPNKECNEPQKNFYSFVYKLRDVK